MLVAGVGGRLRRRAERLAGAEGRAVAIAAADGTTGGNLEGKEQRFGIVNSALWAAVTTDASNGSVNSAHDAYTGIGGARAARQHDDRRGDLRRGRLGPLRDAAVRPAGGVHRRPDGGPHARVPGQEDRGARGQAGADRDAVRAARRARGHRARDRDQVRRAVDLQLRARRASRRRSTPTPRRPTTTAPRSPATPASCSRTRPATWARSGSPSPTCSAAWPCSSGRFVPLLAALAVAGSLASKRVAPAGAGHVPHRHADLRGPAPRRDRDRRARSPSSPPSCSARSSRA